MIYRMGGYCKPSIRLKYQAAVIDMVKFLGGGRVCLGFVVIGAILHFLGLLSYFVLGPNRQSFRFLHRETRCTLVMNKRCTSGRG